MAEKPLLKEHIKKAWADIYYPEALQQNKTNNEFINYFMGWPSIEEAESKDGKQKKKAGEKILYFTSLKFLLAPIGNIASIFTEFLPNAIAQGFYYLNTRLRAWNPESIPGKILQGIGRFFTALGMNVFKFISLLAGTVTSPLKTFSEAWKIHPALGVLSGLVSIGAYVAIAVFVPPLLAGAFNTAMTAIASVVTKITTFIGAKLGVVTASAIEYSIITGVLGSLAATVKNALKSYLKEGKDVVLDHVNKYREEAKKLTPKGRIKSFKEVSNQLDTIYKEALEEKKAVMKKIDKFKEEIRHLDEKDRIPVARSIKTMEALKQLIAIEDKLKDLEKSNESVRIVTNNAITSNKQQVITIGSKINKSIHDQTELKVDITNSINDLTSLKHQEKSITYHTNQLLFNGEKKEKSQIYSKILLMAAKLNNNIEPTLTKLTPGLIDGALDSINTEIDLNKNISNKTEAKREYENFGTFLKLLTDESIQKRCPALVQGSNEGANLSKEQGKQEENDDEIVHVKGNNKKDAQPLIEHEKIDVKPSTLSMFNDKWLTKLRFKLDNKSASSEPSNDNDKKTPSGTKSL